MLKLVVFLLFVLHMCLAEDVNKISDKSEFKKSLDRDCANDYSTTCLKLDVVSWIDKLSEKDSYRILPGVSVVRDSSGARANNADVMAELAREFPSDPSARLDAYILKKVSDYLSSHSIRFNFMPSSGVEEARGGGGGEGGGFGGGGGGKKGGGGMGGILAAAALWKGTLLALSLGTIAVIAGKALVTGLIALVISGIIGLKSLAHHDHKTSYEVIAKPIYTHSSSHSVSHEDHGGPSYGHSSYGRSFDVPLPLGLQPGYKPQ